jgi:hypothetical protein
MRREDSFGRDRLVARRGFAWCVLRLAGGRGVLVPSVEAAVVTGATVPSPLPDAAIAGALLTNQLVQRRLGRVAGQGGQRRDRGEQHLIGLR